MRCKICKTRKATIRASPNKLPMCDSCFKKYFENKLNNIYEKYLKNKKCIIGYSGGVDSTVLVQYYDFDVLHLNIGAGEYSQKLLEFVKDKCKSLGRKLIVINLNKLGVDLSKYKKPCRYCAIFKRYLFNRIPYELGYDYFVSGHHLDDELSFMINNILSGNELRNFYKLPKEDKLIGKIKPLYRFEKYEIKYYAKICGFKYFESECPYSTGATIFKLQDIINYGENKIKSFKWRLYLGLLKYCKKGKIENRCKICGYPTNKEICSFCQIVGKQVNINEIIDIYEY